jgi:hypothetical protein
MLAHGRPRSLGHPLLANYAIQLKQKQNIKTSTYNYIQCIIKHARIAVTRLEIGQKNRYKRQKMRDP